MKTTRTREKKFRTLPVKEWRAPSPWLCLCLAAPLALGVFPGSASGDTVAVTGRGNTPTASADPAGLSVAAAASATAISQSVELPAYQVMGQGINQSAAFDQMHASFNKVNVLSRDQIDQTPAMTVGQAVQELPGVGVQHDEGEPQFMEIRGMDENLNIITYDGVNIPSYDTGQRAVAVDDIPSGIVSNMEVYKVLLPDMDAEGIGGQLNLVPKTAADYPGGHILELTAAGGGAPMGGGDTPPDDNPLFNGSLTWADTFQTGGRSRLGVLFTALADNKQFAIQDLEEGYSSGAGIDAPAKSIDQYSERNEEYERLRAGLGLNLNLDVDPDDKYFATLMYGGYNEIRDPKEVTDLNDLDDLGAGAGDTQNPDGSFTITEDGAKNDIEKELTNVFTDFRTLAADWGGTNDLDGRVNGLSISYKASYSAATQVEPIDDSYKFESLPGVIGGTVTYDNIPNDGIDPTINTSNLTGQNNPANYYLKEADNGPSETDVDEWGFQGDGKLRTDDPFGLAGISGLLQFGGKARFSYTDYNQITYEDDATASGTVANANAGDLVLLSGLPTTVIQDGPYYPGGGYDLGVEPTLAGLQNTDLTYLNGAGNPATMSGWMRTPADEVGDLGADYSAYENIYAVYGMDTLTWDKLQVMGGLRIEATTDTYNYSDIYGNQNDGSAVGDPSQVQAMTGYLNFIDVLPALGAKYDFTPRFQTRLNYSESVGRPTQQEYVPNVGEDGTIPGTDPDAGNVLNEGNPDLKPILSYNFDSSWEYYPMKGAILGLDLFEKDLSNYIVTDYALYDAAEAQNANAQGVVTYSNIPWSRVYGIEYQYQQQYTMLPWGLDGLGVRASASNIGSYCPTYIDAGNQLPSQSNLIWNAGIFYKAHGLTVDFGGSFTGANIADVGDPTRGVPDYWYADYFEIDGKVSYAVDKNFSVYADLNNLNNAPLEFYAGSPAYPLQDEFYGPSFTGGVKADF